MVEPERRRGGLTAGVAYKTIGLAAGLALTALVVQQLIALLLALVLTIIVSLPLAAAADFGERHKVPRPVGAVFGLLAVIAVMGGLTYLVIPSFLSEAKQFANNLPHTIAATERYLHGVTGVTKENLDRDVSGFVQGYTHHPQRLIAPLESIGLNVAALLASFVVVLITALYIAISPDPLIRAALGIIPVGHRELARQVMSRVRIAWLGWLQAIAIDMLVLGGLLYMGMSLVGLEFALAFAVLSALMTVIPNYGSIISAVPPVIVGLAHSPGKALSVLAVYVVVNQIEGNLILPLVMARTVDMHPALVAIGVLVMAQLFGLIGVVIAIPLLSLAIILVEELWVKPQENKGLIVAGGES